MRPARAFRGIFAAGEALDGARRARRQRRDAGAPDGVPCIWLHLERIDQRTTSRQIVEALLASEMEPTIVVTEPVAPAPGDWPEDVEVWEAPADGRAVRRFVEERWPALLLWIGSEPDPICIGAVIRRGGKCALFETGREEPGVDERRRRRAGRRRVLRRLDLALVRDEAAKARLGKAGVAADRLVAVGDLSETATPLPCEDALLAKLSAQLVGRPAWFAVAVPPEEVAMLLDAHAAAARLTHRLLLVLAPERRGDGAELEAQLRGCGWRVARRAANLALGAETQVCIADAEEELGLWYRLAPLAYIGGTLTGGAGRHPFEAAALGSAILHGPATGGYAETYARLSAAGAVQPVADAAALGVAVGHLIAPERAAALAHAAWDVGSAGAEATDRVAASLLDLLEQDDAA